MSEWRPFREIRPPVGRHWFRLPEAAYGGVLMRPEWVCEVSMHGMGYRDPEPWPNMSNWDGYKRTVPEGLEWRSGSADDVCGKYAFPGIVVFACPFCEKTPSLMAWDRLESGGARLYTVPFRPNRFAIRCSCGIGQMTQSHDLLASLKLWNKTVLV